jgi:acyl-CoA synthetase (AMP-forming)/AMP-acid ligase II
MSISLLLDMAADAYDDRCAVGSRDAGGLSYAELARRAAGGATLIEATGASRVAFLGINGPVFPVLLFAAAAAGKPLTPLNYRLAADQLGELIAALDSPYLVVDEAYRELAAQATDTHLITSAEFLAQAAVADPLPPRDVDGESPAVTLFTSGTTSKPKSVVLRHSNLLSYVLQTVEFAAAEPDDAILVSVPTYHVAGVGTVLTNIYGGRRLAYLPNFSAPAWLESVTAERITHAMLVPTMLVRIVEELGGEQAAAPCLRSLAYGGARMPVPVLEAAVRAFPAAGFVNAYGLTETSSTIALLGPDDHRAAVASTDPAVRARLGSAGRAVTGVELQIRTDDGSVAAPGEPGELWARGAQVSGEYEGLGSVLDADGWFPTRDRALIDAEGYLFIVGRSDDTIIRGGENIAPAEIEDALVQHPEVRDVAVFGVPDEEWGERIVAVVVPRNPGATDGPELRAFVRSRLRGSRTPDDVVFRDELPYTATGKLLRRRLADEVIAGAHGNAGGTPEAALTQGAQ